MDDLTRAQKQLSRALSMARIGEDPEMRRKVRDRGEQFVRIFNALIRLTRVHDLENKVFDQPIHDLHRVLGQLREILGAVHLVAVEDQVYVNDLRVRLDKGRGGARDLGDELKRYNVGSILFHTDEGEDQLRKLIMAFASKPDPVAPRATITAFMAAHHLTGVELSGIYRLRTTDEEIEIREHNIGAIAERAHTAVDNIWNALGADHMLNVLPARRAVAEMLEVGLDEDQVWPEPEDASPMALHAVRVCHMSLLLGLSLGFGGGQLQDLGISALLHDMGYSAREGVVAESADDPGDKGYAPPYERHSTAGARLLMRQRGFSEAKVRRLLGVIEHHDDFADPANPERPQPSLFARILRIAEDYDNLQRVPQVDATGKKRWLSPAEALARMARGAGTRYDPILLQVYINRMGRFPPGTFIQLTDGRVLQTITLVRSPETFDRPLARVVRNADGSMSEEMPLVDLARSGTIRRVLARLSG